MSVTTTSIAWVSKTSRAAGAGGGTLDHPRKADGRERGTAFADEHEGRRFALPLEPAQGPHLVAEQRVGAGRVILDPPHMEHGAVEVDLDPAQVADLGCPQPVTKGEQDHGRVTMAMPPAARRSCAAGDFPIFQFFSIR
jgi:hypothetical protein